MTPNIDEPGFREWHIGRFNFQIMPISRTIGVFLTFDAPFVDSIAVMGIDLFWFSLRVELVAKGSRSSVPSGDGWYSNGEID